MGILFVFLVAIVLAGVIIALTSRQPYKHKRRQLRYILGNLDPTFNRFCTPVPAPREAMENLNREIRETRRRAASSSHRSRPY
jgi:hypothetical protein